MSEAWWWPWDSSDTWNQDKEENRGEDWPKPAGPSEWALFRNWSAPKTVITDGAAEALSRGEHVDSIIVSFANGQMTVEAPMGVWEHIFVALSHEEGQCEECGEVLDVFRRIAETLGEEE